MPYKFMFKRPVTLLAAGASLCASFGAFAQYNPNIQQNFQPNQNGSFQDWQSSVSGAAASSAAATAANTAAAYQNPAAQFLQSSAPASGYTNDGTLMMGGQKIGNPHQILHDTQVPSFMNITAMRYTYASDPAFGQGTQAQMELATTNGSGSDMLLNRLYYTPNNPYPVVPLGIHNNYQTYQGVLQNAQQANYLPTAADDGKIYVFKTLSAASTQAQNILIKELPNTTQFKAAADPLGGSVGVRVTQNGDAVALSNYLATVKPYDFSWQSAFGPYAAMANYGGPVVFGADGNVNGINPYLDPASFYFNWVMGSDQVKGFQNTLNQQSQQSGNESFGQLAWDSNTNQYVMLSASNQTATPGSVSGTMPQLGAGQTGVFGMHTHPDGGQPSNQDLIQASKLGSDQVIVGPSVMNYVVVPGTVGAGMGEFLFEGRYVTIQTAASIGNNAKGTGREYGAGTYVIVDSQTGKIVGTGGVGNVGLTAGVSIGPPSIMGVAQITSSDLPDHPSQNGTYSSITISTPWGTITGQIEHKTGEISIGVGTPGVGVTTGTGYTTSYPIYNSTTDISSSSYYNPTPYPPMHGP